ncbi:MAG: autotransporter outer membrane beta-barrel domain-containing protein [Hyphomicrobiales bacterium]
MHQLKRPDFGSEVDGTTILFGGFGGYISSDVNFDVSRSKSEISGGQFGGYVTFLNNGFFFDLLGKVDVMDLKYKLPTVGSSSSDVFNYGIVADTGYRMGDENGFIEPVASFVWLESDIDPYNIAGSTVLFNDVSSVRLGGGARAGTGWRTEDGGLTELSIVGRVWNEFEGNYVTSIRSNGQNFVATDNIDGVFGEVTGYFNWMMDQQTSMFVKAGSKFNSDFYTVTGMVGVRYNFGEGLVNN